MSYAIRLDNGEYLVIDAGGNGVSQYLHDTLLAYNGGRPVVVAAWIFTHFHCDHIGGLLDLMEREELRRDFVIKTIVHNFPQKQVLDTASPGDQSNLRRWPNVVALSGAAVCHARTGQTYRFGNATVEMLFTYEDLAPFFVINDRTNPTSHIFTVTVAGQRLLFMGDACGEATSLAVLRYGEYLKCDFVQLSHHGYGDGGTDPRFYPTVGARWVLLPSLETMHLSPVEKQEAERAERVFRNGDRDTLLPLPYAGE
jgi:beta-lactamase superfamily II metal-dependent hydrolase